jgi:hypothetical protein
VAREALLRISPRDRELLSRFYLDVQGRDQICRIMGLTPDQFRLLKCRAKARFVEAVRRALRSKSSQSSQPPKELVRPAGGNPNSSAAV